ncbi:Sap30p NDAI_0K00570 [Naumovozyma dairenensis CBS 421]|uniref:Histone deacetylase complex subunit SAP30 Sin3 binding domain-containing protein n=1 Tax=Naumovozyma dairenensis (strain ATCC 10597 / BCRC 20456 / CBS 421 / NBRC 0211 / NRRL Y-12639) TaxID=1071378 RepID=G0WHI7_NAUDC|nr:hypothetical protein NDAI_0K00570 [Naumovozyma dairenensis CBS 421]CCD27248.1 hypothetical protein NDAI_0K00570 [Naumovozyma dairenensis CBS 421]
MARNTNSNSESETKTTAGGRSRGGGGGNATTTGQNSTTTTTTTTTGTSNTTKSNVKQRLTAAQQQYLKDLVQSHVTNNHPDLIPKPNPANFEEYSDDFLRRYKDNYHLDLPDNLTLKGYLLGSKLGSKTYSYKKNEKGRPDARITKKALAKELKKHFTSTNIKETECIPKFVYKVRNQKKHFKMEFKG